LKTSPRTAVPTNPALSRTTPRAVTFAGINPFLPYNIAPRTRCLALRICLADGVAERRVPPGTQPKALLDFARRHVAWAAFCLARLPPPIRIAPGVTIDILDHSVALRHDPLRRGSGEDQHDI